MATRKAVAASIAASIVFSSLLVSNFAVYAGANENFRLVSLATEERTLSLQAKLLTGVSMLDLLDGSQELLSSSHFSCSSAIDSVAEAVASEAVNLRSGVLQGRSNLSLGPSLTAGDDFAFVQPFNGSAADMTDLLAVVLVHGATQDGSISYHSSDQHLLHLPLRLGALTAACLYGESQVSAALSSLGKEMCNSTALGETMSAEVAAVEYSASALGFALAVSYYVSSVQPCQVSYWITAAQQGVQGPEGLFTFTEQASGSVEG